MRDLAIVCLALVTFGCGGMASATDAGSTDADTDGGPPCSSPDGFTVCGGPNACPNTACSKFCSRNIESDASVTGVCDYEWMEPRCAFAGYEPNACATPPSSAGVSKVFYNIPRSLALLMLQNGAGSFVHYADHSTFTGESIPEPATCPNLGKYQGCGGACGACPVGLNCYGRSPIHPTGICASISEYCASDSKCSSGKKCLTYVVQPENQSFADDGGWCLPQADCEAMALAVPGGMKCRP